MPRRATKSGLGADHTTVAAVATAIASSQSLKELANVSRLEVAPLLRADEFVLGVSTPEFNRPALIRIGVQDSWAQRYNREFHVLNPAIAGLKRHLRIGKPFAGKFADLCPRPLFESRFYKDYMKPQKHLYSLLGAMCLGDVGAPSPTLNLLAIRYEGQSDFTDQEVAIFEILLPAFAWAIHRAKRSADDWAKDVIKSAYDLPNKLAHVAVLLTNGMSNKEIANALGLSLGTVKQYVFQIFASTGAGSRSDLCRMILS